MLSSDFIPKKPFEEFKWKWASLQCTEGLNDPVVLLGVLFRMRKLEKQGVGLKYSSDEFSREMSDLSKDIKDSLNINLASRTGERNLIRNSGQYWRAVGLIPTDNDHSGIIRLTDFGRKVADRETNVTMPEVLEAAHIKPYKYNGADTVANGFAMRVDIHTLFDTGHLRISPEGEVVLSGKARLDYGATIPPRILIPSFTDIENIRWRWDNFNGI